MRQLAPGTMLCRLEDLDKTGAKGVEFGDGPDSLDIVVVKDGEAVRAYVNNCPHQHMPLDTFPDRFLDFERQHLVCSTHGARFRIADGLCVKGPCRGKSLRPVAIEIDGNAVKAASAT